MNHGHPSRKMRDPFRSTSSPQPDQLLRQGDTNVYFPSGNILPSSTRSLGRQGLGNAAACILRDDGKGSIGMLLQEEKQSPRLQ